MFEVTISSLHAPYPIESSTPSRFAINADAMNQSLFRAGHILREAMRDSTQFT